MPHRYLLSAIAVLLFVPAVRAIDPSELKPGLIAVYRQPELAPNPGELVRIEPTVALSYKAGESVHPRLAGVSQAHWSGYVNIVRPGKFTFSGTVGEGQLTVKLNGKDVLQSPRISGVSPVKGEEVTLNGGVQPIEVTYTSSGRGAARVELFWSGPGFVTEPLAHQFLGHLAKDRPPQFTRDVQLERGRFRFEELGCAKCHTPAATDKMEKGLVDRMGPNLTEVAKRAHAGWIDAWLADPAKLRPHTTMPKMFADTDAGKVERHAAVRYLVALAGQALEPVKAPVLDNPYRQSMERGKVLFSVTGCATCHSVPQAKKPVPGDDEDKPALRPEDSFLGLGTPEGPAAKYSLGSLGSKFTPTTLAAFLQHPLKTHPAGRMPNMNLSAAESQDLARFLCRVTDDELDPKMPTAPVMKTNAEWIELGRKVVVEKGCVNCHAIEPSGKALAPTANFPALAAIRKSDTQGCLTPKPGTTPVYTLDAADTAAITAFLKDGLSGAGSPSPMHAARTALRRFNCLNCHSKDGEGGISSELADEMRLLEKAQNADDVRPPLLTGIGHKSRTMWLKAVLTQGSRARPWMQLRMPQYGESHVGFLPEPLAALEGTTPDDAVHKVALTPDKVAAGRQIVGKGGLGCISCHDIAGVPNTGTRGPDLATINQRVRYDWYERWLHQPLRMAPGTRMPQAFVDGKSTLGTVLNGDPNAQAEAMWAYLSLGPSLPLPDGMEPPKGLIIAVKERPELLRTFMPEAGNRAVAVGYPGGVSLAFSADQCRFTYAWAGNYLDASPVWNNRGGAPAKLLGPKFWSAPPGHPWGLTANPNIPPDFIGRANHPAYGMPLPLEPARIYDGPRVVAFDGYSLDAAGQPTFRYRLSSGPEALLNVAETPMPLKTSVAAGFTRKVEFNASAGYQTWFLAGVANKLPRAYDAIGKPVVIAMTGSTATVPVNGVRLVLPIDGDKATVLELVNAPMGTSWHLTPRNGIWLAIVKFPSAKVPLKASFALRIWGLPKDDDALLNGLST